MPVVKAAGGVAPGRKRTRAAPVEAKTDFGTDDLSHETDLDRAKREAFLRSKGIDPKQPFQLEIWPDGVREIPNDYARSAIFTVRNKREPRASFQGAVIFHVEKTVRISYTGVELRADDDELVWQQILDYAKRLALGEAVAFNLHQICVDLNWSVNERNYQRVRMCISRLKANEVKVENERSGKGIGISLIRDYDFEGAGTKGTKYRVWLDPRLIMLFAGRSSTRIAWQEYRNLKPIARRLYDYVASHKHPFPLKLETFHQMCASDCQSERKWRFQVKEACAELEEKNMVRRAWVADDLIYSER